VMQHGDEIDENGPEGDAIRQALKADIKEQEKLIASSGTLLGYRYEGSPIIVPDGTPEPPDDARKYVPVARPGHRAPHVWLDDGQALFDRLGPGFTLLRIGLGAPDATPIIDAAAAAGMPLRVLELAEPMVAEVYDASLVLIRPDLMVAWRGTECPDDAVLVINTVRGAG
jgi:hypothetical protein